MIHLIYYRMKQLLRARGVMFWALMFPILLGTMFAMTFKDASDEMEQLDPISVAVVVEQKNERSEQFLSFVETADDTLKPAEMSADKAEKWLAEGKVDGIFFTGNENTLTVASSDINSSILESMLDSYNRYEAIAIDILKTHPEKAEQALAKLTGEANGTKEVSLGGKTLDSFSAYFFALIAMACMYGCFLGLRSPTDMQPNISALGARRSITPTHRLKLIIADMLATFTLHFANVLILLFYLRNVLKVDFGDRLGGMILIILAGSLVGVSLGMLVGSIGKMRMEVKHGITMGISMICSFLAGLMIGDIKDTIEHTAPIINRINPAALISDAFYCLCVYDDMTRYYRSLIILVVISAVLLLGSFLMVRRERYDSI